jgi:hypothetical protein
LGQAGELYQRGFREAADLQEAHSVKDQQEILDKIVDVVLKYRPPKKEKKS